MAKSVMIVEDNELNMKLFNDLLRANGYATLPMRNGHDALDALEGAPAGPHHHGHPASGDFGPRSDAPHQAGRVAEAPFPVIAVTAFAMKGDEERIRQGGCEGYLSKPISVASFIATVKSFIGEA